MKNSIFNAVCKTRYLALLVLLIFTCGNVWGVEATFNLWQTAPGSPTTNNNVSFAYSKCVFGASNANAGFNVGGQVVATMPTGATVSKIVVHKTSNAWAKKANLKVYYGNTLKQTITQPSGDVTINLNGSEQTAGTYKFKNEGSDSKVAFVKSIVITYTVSECSNPEIGTQPASATYTVEDSPTALSVTASGTSLTYQWYSNTTATNTGGTIITGQTSRTYTPSTASNGTFYYYCVVSSGSCSTNSNVATITVNKASATIKLSEAGAESSVSGTHYSGDSYTLPSSTEATCGTKVLVGWSTVTVEETDTKPTSNFYEKGASVTLSAGENKFYAVFATASAGATTITKMVYGDDFEAGDNIIIVAQNNKLALYQETTNTSWVSNWTFTGDVPVVADIDDEKKYLTVSAGDNEDTWKLGDATNGFLYTNTSNELYCSTTNHSNWELISYDDGTFRLTAERCLSCRTDLSSSNKNLWRGGGSSCNSGTTYYNIYKYGGGTTYSDYSTTCCDQLAAPENPGETPNSTGAVLTWDAVSGATGYEVKIDGGEWTSTGNGTTTGYTITGKTCGGTSVSWQVRATGDGSTNCAKGAATTARNFTTTACACTDQYTYFWGTQITNENPSSSAYASHHFECFNTWNSTEGKTGLITLPNSDTENYWFVGYNGYYYNSNLPGGGRSWCTAIANMNFANSQSDGKVLGWDGGYSYPRGATGYIRIYSDNTNSNKYAAFIPSGYILRWKNNRNSDAWTSYPFTDTGASNYWETDLVQLGADLSSDKVWVGLPTSGMSESFTWCGKSEEKNLIGVGKKTGASTWADNGIVAGDANQWGKWRIEITNNATNWNVHFVPYWKATYDVNGGGAISPTATNEGPVSCEGDATARQVTLPAAPSYAHHVFGGWKSSADNQIYNGGVTVSLSQNTTFTAQWTNSQYDITATLTNVTTETSFPVTYTYTGSAANVTYTFAAASGYRLPDAVTVTGSTYEWDKTTGELTLTGTITGAVSITIIGVQTHTVTWKSNGADYVSPVVYDHGAELALPAGTPSVPTGCSGKKFVGWTSDPEISTETSTKPTIISAGGAVETDATYRAVFADVTGDPSKFKRVTQLSDITVGGEIVFGFYVSPNTKLCGLDFTSWTTYSCATGVDETSNKIPVPSDANIWTVSKESGYWVFTNKEDGTTKLATSSSNSNNELDPNTQTYYKWNIGASSSGTNNFYVQLYNGSSLTTCALELYSSVWKIYSPTGSTNYASNSYTALKLYVPAGSEDNYITLCSTCTTPSDVAASGITTDGATITWNGTSQENNGGSGTGFVVKYGTNSTRDENSNTINVVAGTNTADLTGLAQGTKYYVWVQSKCDDSWSTTPAEFTTLVSHTATFYDVDGSTVLQSGSVVEGSAITYSGSTPVSCDAGVDASTTFVGWASAPWSGKLAKGSIPSTFYDIAGGESLPNMGNSNMSFYPVFAKATGDPLTNHAWSYTFSAQTYKANDTKTLEGTEGGNTVNADWALLTYNQSSVAITNWGSFDNDRGSKIGKNDDDYVTYMYLSSASFDGTITAVKISTSGNSGVTANVSATVGGTTFYNGVNSSLDISSSNAEYSFTGSKAISGDDEVVFIWEQESAKALYIKKIEVDYSTGGDISYSNYMTSCATCVTPTSVAASDITESGATITWSGTSNSGTTGFKVLWSTSSSRPAPATGNNADTNSETKTYSITDLNAGTTYYVWVQSKCDGSWSESINFTTKAIHTITFVADNGTISGGSVTSGTTASIINGETLTFPNVTSTTCGTFVGWTTGDYDDTAAPSPFYTAGAEMADITAPAAYKAVYRTASGAETLVTDNLTATLIGVSIYQNWSGKTDVSSAVYAGNTTGSSAIQMRSSDNSGITTTTSGGNAKKVTITWNSSTSSGRTIDVYGKKAAYSSAADLYSAGTQGTKIGSIVYGTSTELEIDGDYQYIGLRSNSGALYIDNIAIQWYGSPMHYMTSPTCNPMVGITESLSSFTYTYGAGPSASQSFTVSGSNLTEDLVVTAPTNYEVSKTENGTYSSSVNYTPTEGAVSSETVYIRLAAGLNVGTYNYAAASGLQVTSTGATAKTAALTGSVTKATGTFVWTDFNAVDHYEAELTGASVAIPYNYTYVGDGTVNLVKVGNYGTIQTDAKTYTLTAVGEFQLRAEVSGGVNYTNPANTLATFIVYKADRFYDNIHADVQEYMSITLPIVERGSYTAPELMDADKGSANCAAKHYKFMGWVSEANITAGLPDDDAYKAVLIPAGTPMTATGTNYYAVWAEDE